MQNRIRWQKPNLEPGLEKIVRRKKTPDCKETEEEIKFEICLNVDLIDEHLLEVL